MTGHRCPYIETTPASREEIAAWEIIRKYVREPLDGIIKAMEIIGCADELTLDLVNCGRATLGKMQQERKAAKLMFQYVLRMASDGGKAVISMFNEVGEKGAVAFKKLDKSIEGNNLTLDKFTKAASRVGVGITAATAAMAYMVTQNMEQIDSNAKLAQSFDITNKALADNALVFSEAGLSVEEMGRAWNDMQANMRTDKGASAIKALGLDLKELLALSPDQQFAKIAEKIAKIEDANTRAAAATDVFGKDLARKLLPLMDGYADSVAEAAAFNEKFGISLSQIDVSKVEAANDAMGRVKSAIGGVINTISVQMAPAIEAVSNWLTSLSYDKEAFAAGVAKSMDVLAILADHVRLGYIAAGVGMQKIKLVAAEVQLFIVEKMNAIGEATSKVLNLVPGVNVEARFSAQDVTNAQQAVKDAQSDLERKIKESQTAISYENTMLGRLNTAREESQKHASIGSRLQGQAMVYAAEGTKKTTKETKKLSDALKEANNRTEQLTGNLLDMVSDGKIGLDELAKTAEDLIKSFLNEKNSQGVSIGTQWFSDIGRNAWSTISSFLPSFSTGIDRVPGDMVAEIHEGEAVLRPNDAEDWRAGRGGKSDAGNQVIINNYSSAKVSSTRTQHNSSGGRDFIIQLDEANAELFSDPSSRTSRAVRNAGALTNR